MNNIKMAKKYGAKTVEYKDLPETHQLAIAYYMALDGEAWEVFKNRNNYFNNNDSGWYKMCT